MPIFYLVHVFEICIIDIFVTIDSIDNSHYEYCFHRKSIKEGDFLEKIRDRVFVRGVITDCRGAMTFILVDSVEKIQIKGEFLNGLDTLKSQGLIVNPIDGSENMQIIKSFQPIPTGIWVYRDLSGNILGKKKYFKGAPKLYYDR